MNRDKPDVLMVGIAAVNLDAKVATADMETLNEWLAAP